ncbi:MAG: hypothetical protein IKR46_00185, partial [Clostridia bacterium]|nr:hypothetical protein [Clostridia bacterium]
QLYRLFDKSTPIKADCGKLCDKRCCKGDDGGMYLFPGEEKVYRLLKPSWAKIEESDFFYEFGGKKKNVPILFCNGNCDRYQRPLACRIFPLTPYINTEQKAEIIVDPRAKSICPLSQNLEVKDFDGKFCKNVKKAFSVLEKSKEIAEYLKKYSEYIDDCKKFFEE